MNRKLLPFFFFFFNLEAKGKLPFSDTAPRVRASLTAQLTEDVRGNLQTTFYHGLACLIWLM